MIYKKDSRSDRIAISIYLRAVCGALDGER